MPFYSNTDRLVTMFTVLLLHGFLLAGFSSCFVFDSPDGAAAAASLPPLTNRPLRIGSFNIQILGQTKYAKKDVINVILKILSRYDVVQILEIRDSKQTVFESLRQDLNKYMQSNGVNETYKGIISGRLGRSDTKEQYGFLYRSSKLNATDTYQFHDDHDFFEREPFGVLFSSPYTVIDKFALIATHIQPSKAAEEIDNLTTVYEHVQKHWHIDDIIVAGDFNADCNYLTQKDWTTMSFWNDARFTWLVDDRMDTTVADSFCAYDRFVVGGAKLPSAVISGSVQAYRYDSILGLNKSMALQVSDHFPIELEIKGLFHVAAHQNIQTSLSFTVIDTKPVSNVNNIRAVYRSPSCAGSSASVKLLRENTHMDHVTVAMTSSTADNIVNNLITFSRNCPGTLSPELLSNVQAYVSSSLIRSYSPDIYGLQLPPQSIGYPIEISCTLISPYTCKVTVTRIMSGK